MSVNSLASNFSADVSTYIAQKTLMIAMKRLAVYQIVDKVALPKNNSRTFQYTRYERMNLPQSALSEGVTPSDSSMSISTVTAVMDQWGAVIPLSDVSIDSVKHPVLQKAIELAAHMAQETVDREIVKVLLTGSQIYYPAASTSSRSAIASSDVMSSAAVGKTVSHLRGNGAIPFDQDLYVGVFDSYSEVDMTTDATFVDAAKYGMIKKLLVNEVGEWKGVRWIRSNTLPSVTLLTGGSSADSATAGSLANSTTYNFSFSVVDAATGHETYVGASQSATTGASHSSVDCTTPALPAGATAGSKFNIYAGLNGGTRYLAYSSISASTLQNVGSIPTSGQVAQATPPSGFAVHFAFILGKESVSCIELNKIKAYLTPATPSDSDPLVQRRKVGWKCDFKTVICNNNFLARIEHATNFG